MTAQSVEARHPRASGPVIERYAVKAIALAAVLISGAVPQLAAQTLSVGIAPTVGITLPMGEFSQYVERGSAYGVRLNLGVAPGVNLLLDGGQHQFSGTGSSALQDNAPDMSLGQLIGGVEAELVRPGRGPVSLIVQAGAGASRFEADSYTGLGGTTRRGFTDTGLTTSGGLQLGYSIGDHVMIYGDGRISFVLLDQTKTLPLTHQMQVQALSSVMTLPLQIGLRARV